MQYELFYLVGFSKEANLPKIKTGLSEIVVFEGGVFEEKQVVEKRKMAYEIKRENRGFYVAQRFNLNEPEKIQNINRKIGLYPNILRALIVRAEELPELTSREEREAKAAKETRVATKKPVRVEEKVIAPRPVIESKAEPARNASPASNSSRSDADWHSDAGGETMPVKKAPKKTEKLNEEDIDKKLEEILNI